MRFWDASALVPFLVAEPTTRGLKAEVTRDSDLLVWWGSKVECISALARLLRVGTLDAEGFELASSRLAQLAACGESPFRLRAAARNPRCSRVPQVAVAAEE
jgi:uncharacterized protein